MDFLSQLTGSFAQPAAENPTVEMIEAAYRHHQLPWRYINCEVAPRDLGDAVRGARAMRFAGFNCSLPHKVAVIQHLDGLGESASIMQAVNCVVRRGDRFIGENTDGQGFLMSLRTQIDPIGKHLVLLGAGGAARAIAIETALAGLPRLTIVNRSESRGQELAKLVNSATSTQATWVPWREPYRVPVDADIVVHATSLGLYPNLTESVPLAMETLRPELVVADVIPNPLRTEFIRNAADRGCIALDGLGMLVNQAVISIKYWTGVDVDGEVMRQRVIDVLGL